MKNDFMDLKDIIKLYKKKMAMIISITTLSLLACFIVVTFIIKPNYQSRTSILVGKHTGKEISQGDVLMYQGLLKTYIRIAKSRVVTNEAIRSLNAKIDPEKFEKDISIVFDSGTQIIDITVQSNDPKDAAKKSEAVSKAFVQEALQLLPSPAIAIVDEGRVPNKPSSPNKILDLIAVFLIGFVFSLIFIPVRDYLNNSIKDESDIEKYLELPTLGNIPRNKKITLIVENQPKSQAAEAYRMLRTNIQFSAMANSPKVLLVSSYGPKEGKTTTASNLACTISNMERTVLIIDCDLRTPSLHRVFRINNYNGLSDILIKNIELMDVVKPVINNVYCVTAGTIPLNSSDLLASEKMKELIIQAQRSYDYVIIDAPPIVNAADAQILGAYVQGVILVINLRKAKVEASRKAKELLEKINAKIIGVVLCDFKYRPISRSAKKRLDNQIINRKVDVKKCEIIDKSEFLNKNQVKNILFLTDALITGGGETYFYNIENLINRDKFNLYTSAVNGKCINRLNHKAEFTALKRMYISKIFSIKKQIVKKNITLVHANTLRLAVIVILVKRFWGLDFKMIYTKHRHTRVESFNGKMFSNFINKSIDNLIVVCNYEKSKLTNRGIRAEKIVPIANGVDLNQFEFDSRFLKGAPGINIGILARLSDEKNHMFFLDIIEELFRREPLADINVSIAGDGPEMKNIKKTIIKKGLQHKVKLVGNVCNPEGFLKDIDILLLTSKFEMFPMSVLEGMAVGCVTISMNVGGIRECVSHDYNGYLIEDYSKEKFCEVISDVIANREDNEKLVLNGRKYIETNFSIKEVVRRHEDLYEDMLNNKSL